MPPQFYNFSQASWASKPNSLIEILTALEVFPIMYNAVCALISQIPKISGCDMLTVHQGKSKSLRTEMLHQSRKDLNARFEKLIWLQQNHVDLPMIN